MKKGEAIKVQMEKKIKCEGRQTMKRRDERTKKGKKIQMRMQEEGGGLINKGRRKRWQKEMKEPEKLRRK